jgi:hypothetical protein
MKNRTFLLLLFASMAVTNTLGQSFCATSNKLVCQIPFSVGALNPAGVTPDSLQKAQALASSFNAAIATQISQLPLASSSAGTVVLFKSGVPQTYDNLGPILTDRAATVGRHNLFLSFTASQFYFTDLDGLGLGNIPFSYSASSANATSYIRSNLDVHFKMNQYVAIGTFGLTNKLDLSMILPIERVSVGSTSADITQYIVDSNDVLLGSFAGNPLNTSGIASGIGDIVFAAKYIVLSQERGTLSVGLNERVPTGDDRNYLGSGAWGTNPYAVYSYVSKISPHARLGYQWNSESELNPNTVRPGSNLALPGGLQYDIGADWAATKHLTLAADLMGNQYQNAPRITASTLSFNYKASSTSPTTTQSLPTVVGLNSTYWINDISAGAKWNPWKELIVSGNVLFQLNNVGMRARPTPLVGVSYKFGLH